MKRNTRYFQEMKNELKQLSSFTLPIFVLIIIPLIIERNIAAKNLLTLVIGIPIMALGLYFMIKTISTFIKIGRGTLAPWSPTRKLIIGGMYGHVRNPMIIGVIIVLIGESIAVESLNIFIWAGMFFLINNIYFILFEEPNLEKRFGNEYREYKMNVPRWIPRSKPFFPNSELE